MFWKKSVSEYNKTVTEAVESVVRDALKSVDDNLSKISTVTDLNAKIGKFRENITDLQIQKAKREEEFARKEREIEHKVGLHKTQTEQAITLAKREAIVTVREENLTADRKRFEDQMTFVTENFNKQTDYLKTIIGDLAERLPSLAMTADIGKRPTRGK